MRFLKKIAFVIAFLMPFFLNAQEILTGISSNVQIHKESLKMRGARSVSAVKLPFFDDFSNYTGYPNPELWADDQAYINTGFAIRPPSMGVATLDIINREGKVYPHASNVVFPADTLTSMPIRLDSNFVNDREMRISDSIYFSFFYQPSGGSPKYPSNAWERVGDAPEHSDKLVLEFGYATGNTVFAGFIFGEYIVEQNTYYSVGDSVENPFFPGTYFIFDFDASPGQVVMMPADSIFVDEYVWNEVWSTNGFDLSEWLAEDSLNFFKQVLIPITDAQYLRNNFQFRFRNYASLDIDSWNSSILGWASNCDQWNIDYVRLNSGRTYNDTYSFDVAFVRPSTSALKEYTAMPWNQFRPSDMAEKFRNELINLSNNTQNTYYNYMVTKNYQQTIYTSVLNNENAKPYYNNGLHRYDKHANPDVGMSFDYDGADSALFTITHVFRIVGTNDECRSNDTCVYEQRFYNYYAYDDGTAEAGYTLLSAMTNPDASLAVKFTLAEPDSLQAVRMWFNRTLGDQNVEPFTLMVWDDDGGLPGQTLYALEAQYPEYADEFGDFVTFYLEEPIFIEGTFYVGFRKNHDVQLNLGFDQNSDARGKFFYKTTSQWHESFYMGAPMVRPVVGKSFDHSGIPAPETAKCSVYPNPTSGNVFINGDYQNIKVDLFDAFGRLLDSQRLSGNTISLQKYPSGIYFLKIYSGNDFIKTEKIIKRNI